MKLLNIHTREVLEFLNSKLPPFAILSHTGNDEASALAHRAHDNKLQKHLPIFEQVVQACAAVTDDQDFTHIWVHSLCIDASSSADLNEAVNGSFQRLSKCVVCLIYLHDLPANGSRFDKDSWSNCGYWRRVRALQELIVPSKVEFFDKEWNHRCSKTSPEFLPLLSQITGIPRNILVDGSTLVNVPIGVRMSWLGGKTANREEDIAYSGLAITGVEELPVRYGEGRQSAFLRLQEKALQNTCDPSIFVWQSTEKQKIRGLLARSPSDYNHFAMMPESARQGHWTLNGSVRFNRKGIRLKSRLVDRGLYVLLEIRQQRLDAGPSTSFIVYLREWNGVYIRVGAEFGTGFHGTGRLMKINVLRDVDRQTAMQVSTWLSAHDASLGLSHMALQDFKVTDDLKNSTPYEPTKSRFATGRTQIDKSRAPAKTCGFEHMPTQEVKLSTGGRSGDVFDEVPSSVQSCWSNYRRSGQPIDFIQEEHGLVRNSSFKSSNNRDDKVSPYLRSELCDTSSNCDDSDEDTNSEYEGSTSSNESGEEYTPDTVQGDHEFQSLRKGLLQFSYERVRTWMASARYVLPPANGSPTRKHAKPEWQPEPTYLQEEDHEDSQLVIVSCVDEHLHLACPFYISDRDKYRQCLLLHRFKSIKDVIRHLLEHHMKAPYCPICRLAFDTARRRDEHTRARICETHETRVVEGISKRQKSELVKQDTLDLGEEDRWQRVWDILFPNTELHGSPYLLRPEERAVSMVQDHWASHGTDYVLQYLMNQSPFGEQHVDQSRALRALRKLCLDDLSQKIFEENCLAREACDENEHLLA